MLVSTEELSAHLSDSNWVVFDCRHDLKDHARGRQLYTEAHIPGAYFADVEKNLSGEKTGRNGRHPLPKPETFAGFLERCGVTDASNVVSYDDAGGLYAARFWWMLRWIGFPRGAMLDGGWPKWVSEKRPVTQALPVEKRGHVVAKVDRTLIWSAADVVARLGIPEAVIVDARTPERFRGEVEPIDPVAGRVPGSVNRPYKDNLRPDLTFRPSAEVREEMRKLIGERRPENVGHLCGSGITACANLFAMEYAGLSGSKLYAGSWSEWIADPSRPVERG